MTTQAGNPRVRLRRVPVHAAQSLQDVMRLHGADFIRCAYLTFVQREPDEDGMDHYLGRLLDGAAKIRILADMYRSDEARRKDARLPGLERAIALHRLATLPLLGPTLGLLLRVEGDRIAEVRLRRIEQRLIALGLQLNAGWMPGFEAIADSGAEAALAHGTADTDAGDGVDPGSVLTRRMLIASDDAQTFIDGLRQSLSGSTELKVLAGRHAG
jgi:hypothetical protein